MMISNFPNLIAAEDDGTDAPVTKAGSLAAAQAAAKREAAAQAQAAAQKAAQDKLAQQILGSSDTSKWSGEGFGSAQANAADMAKILNSIGITDINQFGQITKQVPTYDEDGNQSGTQTVTTYGNKVTGQEVPNTYSERQTGNAWGGTFAGSGNTGYRVQFDAQGNPMFYTTGASSSDLGAIAPLLAIASIIPSPIQPFAAAANAAVAASNGNVLGALASVAGIPGASEALSSIPGVSDAMSAVKTANQVQNTVKAIESGNALGALSGAAGLTGTGGTEIGDTGVTVSGALKAANLANAISSSNPNAIISAASGMIGGLPKTDSNAPMDAEGLSQLDPEERAAYDKGGMQGLRDYVASKKAEANDTLTPETTPTSVSGTESAAPPLSSETQVASTQSPLENTTSTAPQEPQPSVEITAPLSSAPEVIYEPVVSKFVPSEDTEKNLLPELNNVVVTAPKQTDNTNVEPSAPLNNPVENPLTDNVPNIEITAPRISTPEITYEPKVDTFTPTETIDTTTPPSSTPSTPKTPSTPSTTKTTTTGGLPSTTPSKLTATPLDSSPQMLKAAPIQQQNPARMAELHQLYQSLTPEIKAALATHGIEEPQVNKVESDSAPTFMADGGSAYQTAVDAMSPRWAPAAKIFLEAAPVVEQKPRLGALTHLSQGVLKGARQLGGLAHGGLPNKYEEAAPKGHKPEFITGLTGYYAHGDGTGQSDDIPAMLHEGDFVVDAEAVSALGDGSSKAGAEVLSKFQHQIPHRDGGPAHGKPVAAKIADGEYVFPEAFVTALGGGDNKAGSKLLDGMRKELREHKRSASINKIPPKAKSPLDYLKMAKG